MECNGIRGCFGDEKPLENQSLWLGKSVKTPGIIRRGGIEELYRAIGWRIRIQRNPRGRIAKIGGSINRHSRGIIAAIQLDKETSVGGLQTNQGQDLEWNADGRG